MKYIWIVKKDNTRWCMEESLYGSITKITYFNEDNGYGVVKIKLNYQDHKIAKYRAKLFTNLLVVTCVFDRKPIIDEEYDFFGEFVTNQYGIQFKAKSFSRRNEQTLEGVVAYLSSDFFPGIGKTTATKIFNTLGSDCLEKIRNDKNVLDEVNLTEAQKDVIYNNLLENKIKEETTLGFLKMGITMTMSLKIMSFLKENALEIVKNNPYCLIDLVEGICFYKADKIALENGIEKNSPLRMEALINYLINGYIYSYGDTYIEYDKLLFLANEKINQEEEILTKDLFNDTLKSLVKKNKIHIDKENNIYDSYIYNSENMLATYIGNFLKDEFDYGYKLENIGNAINWLKEELKIEYSEKQLVAIETALKENISIITGGPGTGKTTIIKGIIESYVYLFGKELVREEIALLAPTGRASKRLNEVTRHPAQTIHKFLGYEGHGVFRHGADNKVNARLVIIDEVSMVDVSLASKLFSSLNDGTKIVLVGDVDQLPSVGPGEVLANLIESKEITVTKLDKIHRQAEGSSIISFAHSINSGYLPETILEKQKDRNFVRVSDNELSNNIIKVIEQAINSGMDLIKDIQVLIPLYKGENGIHMINERLQEKFNPLVDRELKHLSRKFRVNDKVIQLVNRSEKQVMNGDIGYVITLDYTEEAVQGLTVLFDNGPVYYKKDELEDLAHAYAISIHKAQGSEFDLAIVPFSYKYYIMLKRKLIYTAVTRAKKYLIMLGNIEALQRGIQGIETRRKTKLVERMKKIFENEVLEFKETNEMENLSPYDFLD